MTAPKTTKAHSESGNVIFFILLAIALIGLVTVAIRSGGGDMNIDKETLVIRISDIRQYASNLERGISFIMQNGVSETDIRFPHSNAPGAYGAAISDETSMFNEKGGGAEYRLPPQDISSASYWEFYGNSSIPGVGTDAPELIAVLPNVTAAFCAKINDYNSQTATPAENGDCDIHNTSMRFATGTLYQDSTPNTLDTSSFSVTPAMEACVSCAGASYHYYHVLLAR